MVLTYIVQPAKKSVIRHASKFAELKYVPRYLIILGCGVRLSIRFLSFSIMVFFILRKSLPTLLWNETTCTDSLVESNIPPWTLCSSCTGLHLSNELSSITNSDLVIPDPCIWIIVLFSGHNSRQYPGGSVRRYIYIYIYIY